MIFAKNELMLDEIRQAVLLDIFWKLLEFDPNDEGEHMLIQSNNASLAAKGPGHATSVPD